MPSQAGKNQQFAAGESHDPDLTARSYGNIYLEANSLKKR